MAIRQLAREPKGLQGKKATVAHMRCPICRRLFAANQQRVLVHAEQARSGVTEGFTILVCPSSDQAH